MDEEGKWHYLTPASFQQFVVDLTDDGVMVLESTQQPRITNKHKKLARRIRQGDISLVTPEAFAAALAEDDMDVEENAIIIPQQRPSITLPASLANIHLGTFLHDHMLRM